MLELSLVDFAFVCCVCVPCAQPPGDPAPPSLDPLTSTVPAALRPFWEAVLKANAGAADTTYIPVGWMGYDAATDYDGSGYGTMGYKLSAAAANGTLASTRICPGVRDLLAAGANVHFKDPNGNTALHGVVMMGKKHGPEIIELLLKHGASKTDKNLAGQTALDLARQVGNVAAIKTLEAGASIPACSAPMSGGGSIRTVSSTKPTRTGRGLDQRTRELRSAALASLKRGNAEAAAKPVSRSDTMSWSDIVAEALVGRFQLYHGRPGAHLGDMVPLRLARPNYDVLTVVFHR